MKVCIPVTTNKGLKVPVNAHFGSAPYFLLFNTADETFDVIANADKKHMHGMCHPLKTLEPQQINVVVCNGMGVRAVQKLNEGGIRAYRAEGKTAVEVINKYKQGVLAEITVNNACVQHTCDERHN